MKINREWEQANGSVGEMTMSISSLLSHRISPKKDYSSDCLASSPRIDCGSVGLVFRGVKR
jgi:hypothetical protein